MGLMTTVREESSIAAADSAGDSMVTEIGRSMTTALKEGNAVVCIATGTRRRRIEQQLKVGGIDVVAVLMREQLVCLNALHALSTIIVDGVPDVIRFAEVIGASVDRAAARYPRVLLFGEFAGLPRSSAAGAVQLDALWESLVSSRPVFFRCQIQQ